jgi:hypothetical protein
MIQSRDKNKNSVPAVPEFQIKPVCCFPFVFAANSQNDLSKSRFANCTNGARQKNTAPVTSPDISCQDSRSTFTVFSLQRPDAGLYRVEVGSSSRDLRVEGEFRISQTAHRSP